MLGSPCQNWFPEFCSRNFKAVQMSLCKLVFCLYIFISETQVFPSSFFVVKSRNFEFVQPRIIKVSRNSAFLTLSRLPEMPYYNPLCSSGGFTETAMCAVSVILCPPPHRFLPCFLNPASELRSSRWF
jgi:hypothetical protein